MLKTKALDSKLLENPLEVAISGVTYLSTVVKDSGLFHYKICPKTNELLRGYNILRHCGTIWSMLDVYQKAPCPLAVFDAAERALFTMHHRFIRPYKKFDHLCVLGERGLVKVGGLGLAILALCSYYDIKKDADALDVAKKLGNFALSLIKENGDMVHRFDYATGKEFMGNTRLPKRCEYYPGEVLYGLLRLYESTQEDKWLRAVLDNKFHLDGQYGVPERNHWMLYTLKHLYKHAPSKEIYTHAESIADSIMQDSKRKATTGNCCGMATYTEGLLSFFDIAASTPAEFSDDFRSKLLDCIEHNLRFQLKYRHSDGYFLLSDKEKVMRIDSVQHNVSSFLYYAENIF